MNGTLVFGYSDNPERYSNMAYQLLKTMGHQVIGFNPREDAWDKIPSEVGTLTLYISPKLSTEWSEKLLAINCQRVIFNPGTESAELIDGFKKLGAEVVIGCTLVMLKTGQF